LAMYGAPTIFEAAPWPNWDITKPRSFSTASGSIYDSFRFAGGSSKMFRAPECCTMVK